MRDAVGLAKPWSGGGLIWGLKAARIMLETFPDFEAYHKKTSRFFAFRIAKGRLADFMVHFLGRNFPLYPSKTNYLRQRLSHFIKLSIKNLSKSGLDKFLSFCVSCLILLLFGAENGILNHI